MPIGNNKVMEFGGFYYDTKNAKKDVNDIFVYDMSELLKGVDIPCLTYVRVKHSLLPRYDHSTIYYKDKVYIIGGQNGKSGFMKDSIIFDLNEPNPDMQI